MATPSLAQPAHPSTTDLEHVSGIAARVLRGQKLYREHAEEIRFEDGVWFVPSQHDATSVYEVVIGRRGEFCECRDFEYQGGGCKHVIAATIAKAKSAPCVSCGKRFRHRELYPVPADNLTFFEDELLCRGCARAHGML
jgi:hypothetical protein